MKTAERAACKLKQSRGRVFRFNLMELGGRQRLHARNVSEQPEQQINRVNALIDQRAAAVQCQRAAPTRIRIVLGWPIPFHARVHQQNLPQLAAIDPILQSADVRLHPVLKNHA